MLTVQLELVEEPSVSGPSNGSLHSFIDSFMPTISRHTGPQMCVTGSLEEQPVRVVAFYPWEEHTSFLGAGNVFCLISFQKFIKRALCTKH